MLFLVCKYLYSVAFCDKIMVYKRKTCRFDRLEDDEE